MVYVWDELHIKYITGIMRMVFFLGCPFYIRYFHAYVQPGTRFIPTGLCNGIGASVDR